MRIRFITLYYPPEVGAAQRRISELARRLAARGHEVTILTGFPNYPSGKKPDAYCGKWYVKEQRDGCTVIRLPHYIAPNRGFFKRLMIHVTFALAASIYSPLMKRDDIVYLESPPLFNGFIGLATKWVRRIPYLFNLADLWPQTAVELGILTNRPAIKMAERLERLFYRHADRILAITRGLQTRLLERGYPEEKVPLLTNGVDLDVFHPDVTPDEAISNFRPENGILVLYAGTHGLIYSLDTLLQAADRLRQERFHFLFIGDGADKPRLMSLADDLKLPNITFLPPRTQADMPHVFRGADVCVLSLKDLPISNAIIPVKCLEIMACGVPVIFCGRGEMADHIGRSGGGEVIEPDNSDILADSLRRFATTDAEERKETGHREREYIIEHFSRQKIVSDLESIMHRALADER